MRPEARLTSDQYSVDPFGSPGYRPSVRPAVTVGMFATAVAGVGPLLAAEIVDRGIGTVRAVGFDGRNDVVLFEAGPAAPWRSLRMCEDVFVQTGHAVRAHGDRPGWVAERLCRDRGLLAAMTLRCATSRPVSTRATVRVIARLLSEEDFLRTDLRRALTRTIGRLRPRWTVADPADVEVWAVEYRSARLVAGVRLTDVSTRQHGGRREERPGALRPTLAAAMVSLAGRPPGILLDPCCGSGTVLAEAHLLGWRALGLDLDAEPAAAAARNVPAATVGTGDARHLELDTDSVDAYVSNLPFGQRFTVEGEPTTWLATVLAEAARVTRPGARIVLLHPDIPRPAVPVELRFTGRHGVRLLGTPAAIWVCRRR